MRTRNKILAFVLAMLMIVGVLPLSVFAATGKSADGDKQQTREEWVAANGGKMLFGSSFDDASKISGDKIASDAGMGSGTVGRAAAGSAGATRIWTDTAKGALCFYSNDTAADYWPYINPGSTNGEQLVIEMSLKFTKHLAPVGESNAIAYFAHYSMNGEGQRVDAHFGYIVTVDENTWGISFTGKVNDAIITYKLGEMANFALVCDPVTRTVALYVDGVFVGQGYNNDANAKNGQHHYNYNSTTTKGNGYPDYGTIRFLQISGKRNVDFELHDLYVYQGVNKPYGAKDDGAVTTNLGDYIFKNGHKLVNVQTFDNVVKFPTTALDSGDGYSVNKGQTYVGVIANGDLQINSGKNAYTYLLNNGVDNSFALRFEAMHKAANNTDVYLDFYTAKGVNEKTNKIMPGDTIVLQGSFRKSVQSDNAGWNLFDIACRTSSRNGMGGIYAQGNGGIVVKGTQSTKNNVVLGYLSSERFTDVAFIINTKNNTFSVALDGQLVLTDEPYLAQGTIDSLFGGDSKKILPTEIRVGQIGWNGARTDAYLDIDNIFVYAGANINSTNFFGKDAQVKSGWVQTDEGYWQYYENGAAVVGSKVIDGKTYYFGTDGFFSYLEREWLVSFNDQTNGGLVAAPDLSAYDEMHASAWKYSALWTHIYKEGKPGNPKGSTANTWGLSAATVAANSAAVNPKFVRTISGQEEIDLYNLTAGEDGTYPTKGYTVFNFDGYVAIEVDYAVDKDVDMVIKLLSNNELGPYGWGKSPNVANYGKYDDFIKNAKGSDPNRVGWHTVYADLAGGSGATIAGSIANAEPIDVVKDIQFQTDWDNPNANNYFDDVKIVFANINLVKPVAVKSDVCPANLGVVRTENGKTYIYKDNMSDPNVGWVEYDGNKYFADADGVVQTGVYNFFDTRYEFDDNGKLVGFANGIYTINGKNYYYQNGVAKIGEFTVDGMSFNTKGDGSIVNMNGVVGGTSTGSYLKITPAMFEGITVYTKGTFDARPVTGDGSYFGSANTATMADLKDEDSANQISAILRRTKFHMVERATGDVALRMNNLTNYYDSYIDFPLTSRRENSTVFDVSVKLGEDWNASAMFLQLQDRGVVTDWRAPNIEYTINPEGYIVRADNIICRLSTTEYTRFTVVHKYSGADLNYFDIYVNGVKVFTDSITNSNFRSPTQARFMQFHTGDAAGNGTIYVDDIYVYAGETPIAVDTASELKNGIVKDGDFYRYYQNGIIKTGAIAYNGENYVFNSVNGIGAEGFDATGYYCIGGQVQKYVGVTTIDGVDYLFGADYKIVKNANTVQDPVDNMYAYDTDANGVVTDKYIFDGADYNEAGDIGNNKITERDETAIGGVVYNPAIGKNTWKPSNFLTEAVLFDFAERTDISGYDYLRLQLYFGEQFAGKTVHYGIVHGQDMRFFKLTGFNPDTKTYESMDSTPLVWPENLGQLKVNGSAVFVGDYAIYKRTVDGETEYYARTWKYVVRSYNYTVDAAGVATIDIPVSWLDANLVTQLDYISFTTQGWTFNNANAEFVSFDPIEIVSASLYNYETPAFDKNGWINGRYYIDSVMQTGWFNFEGTWYYLDPATGYKVTGIACVPAMPQLRAAGMFYYEFNATGVAQGLATGLFECTEWVYDEETDEYVATEAKRMVKDGAIVTGLQTLDGKKYYVDPETSAILTNTGIYVDTDNDPNTPDELITLGSDGVVSEVFDAWVEIEGDLYYYDASGKLASGYTFVALDKNGEEGGYYFFDTATNVMLKSAWATVYGADMFFTADGKAADGIIVDEAFANAIDNTGYFKDGVPVTGEYTDGEYKYVFVGGMLMQKTAIDSTAPEILIFVIKDGIKNSFFFKVNEDGSFEKTFESYMCYSLEIYDVSGDAPVKLDVVDNKLVIAAGSTSHTYEVRYVPTEHTYEEKTDLAVAPGCGVDGYKVFVCTACGDSYKDIVPATGEHTYGDWQIVTPATCSHEGLKVAYCSCGHLTTAKIDRDPDNHEVDENDAFYAYKAPTCTAAGYESGVCKWCGDRVELNVIEPLGHTANGVTAWFEDVKATCVTKGTEWGYCGNGCGEKVYRTTPVDPDYHVNGINGTITHQTEAGENFVLFQTVIPSTCQTPGVGIFRCLDCGGFVEDVELVLNPDNHEGEWGEEYLVVLDENGDILETIHGSTREEMISKSMYLCGYNGQFRKDCTNPECLLEDGQTRIFLITDLIASGANGGATHSIDLEHLYTTLDPTDPLFGMHYYVCTKCEKAIQATQHVMSDIVLSSDGKTHIIYCEGGCIIGTTDEYYSIEVDCDHKLGMFVVDGNVVGHAEICECGHFNNFVEHTSANLTPMYDENSHWAFCEVCGYQTEKAAHTINTVPGQTATCFQPGWDEYDECTLCEYEEAHNVYNQLPHSIPADKTAFSADEIGHWYACTNYGCTYKHLYEKHTMIFVPGLEATCETDGNIEHDECSVCGWFDATIYPYGVVIPKKNHHAAGDYHYNETEHWQFCDNVNNGVVCGTIIRANHTYVMGENFLNYNDEEGTAEHKCEICDYKKPLTGLDTWWSVLGLTREGTVGSYTYHLYVDGVMMTDYLAKLPDGSYRYFDADGKLVMAEFDNGQFDNISGFGPAGLTNLIATESGYYGYTDTKAAERGAINNAIIDTVDGIMMVEDGALVTGWKNILERDYYFNSKLGDELVNADLREGVLVKSTATAGDLTINALNVTGNAAIIVNVRADGSRLLGVVDNGDGTASLYLDGTVGKMPAGWVTDNYTKDGVKKVYFVLEDRTLACGDYVLTPGGVYWNFDEKTYLRADSYCKNLITDDGVYVNAEGKAANNELVTIDATGKTYFIVNVEGVQSIYTEKAFVLAAGIYYVVDTATGEIDTVNGLYTGWVDADSYALNGQYQVSTFCAIDGNSYYFDGEGNMLVSSVVYIKTVNGGEIAGFAWSFDADGVATKVDGTWVQFLDENGMLIADEKGYYFDADRGLAYGLKNGSVEVGTIYIFDNNGYLIVSVDEYDYNGVIYVIDAEGKATLKEEDDD